MRQYQEKKLADHHLHAVNDKLEDLPFGVFGHYIPTDLLCTFLNFIAFCAQEVNYIINVTIISSLLLNLWQKSKFILK